MAVFAAQYVQYSVRPAFLKFQTLPAPLNCLQPGHVAQQVSSRGVLTAEAVEHLSGLITRQPMTLFRDRLTRILSQTSWHELLLASGVVASRTVEGSQPDLNHHPEREQRVTTHIARGEVFAASALLLMHGITAWESGGDYDKARQATQAANSVLSEHRPAIDALYSQHSRVRASATRAHLLHLMGDQLFLLGGDPLSINVLWLIAASVYLETTEYDFYTLPTPNAGAAYATIRQAATLAGKKSALAQQLHAFSERP